MLPDPRYLVGAPCIGAAGEDMRTGSVLAIGEQVDSGPGQMTTFRILLLVGVSWEGPGAGAGKLKKKIFFPVD